MDEKLLRDLSRRVTERLTGGRKRLLFITGAGLSAESGLPTYRGIGGLYDAEHTEHGVPIEEALSGPMFRTNPAITWHHIARIEASVRGAQPSAAHALIAQLEQQHEVVVLTQNVDGFHRAAGSSRVIDIHGDCHDLLCTRCDYRRTVRDYADLTLPPQCPDCGASVRPDVVLFEEALPEAKLDQLTLELRRGFDAEFSIGTSSLFAYIAGPIIQAARAGVLTVEINPEHTPISDVVDVKFACGAARGLAAIFDRTH